MVCIVTRTAFERDPGPFARKNIADGIKRGFLQSARATASADRTTVFGGRAGRQIDFKTGTGMPGSLWIVGSAGKPIYTLTILDKKSLSVADRKRFFGSLRL